MVKKVILLLLLVFSISCVREKTNYKNTFVVAGTYLEVISPYREAAQVVYKEFYRLERLLSVHDPDSELSRLNNATQTDFKASPELMDIIARARRINRISDGAFDISAGRLYDFWKGMIGEGKIEKFPSQRDVDAFKVFFGMKNISIYAPKQIIRVNREALKIDLSAIAKGFMIDKAAAILRAKGIDSALINAGGDIYCIGKNGDKPWRVGIKDPEQKDALLGTQELLNQAIATSGGYEQFFEFEGKQYSHLIDPRTGFPVSNSILSVSVISRECTMSDSLATAFFVMGLHEITKFFVRNPYKVRAIVISRDREGKRHTHIFQ